MDAAASAFHVSVSLVIVEDDSPVPVPGNWPSAGTKSPRGQPVQVQQNDVGWMPGGQRCSLAGRVAVTGVRAGRPSMLTAFFSAR
jgi:hypothetical protein